MIFVLAGHVDHGKTSLVKSLTGVNTDRLVEEQQRGLTIELGFAYLQTSQKNLGFVDVPGHHRFIHNMIAGVSARQAALLVVAADDGPMPQTREHLDIMKVLGLQQGVVALTKIDRVSPVRLQTVTEEIKQLCAGSFLADAPVFPVSSSDNSGIRELTEALNQLQDCTPDSVGTRNFRLAIDRAFQRKGIGQIVTGTVHTGSVQVGDELFIFPGNHKARVRQLHVQDHPQVTAQRGDRCALNLVGRSGIKRGMWLSALPTSEHRELTVDINLLESNLKPVHHGQNVHVYYGTDHVQASIALFEPEPLPPGSRSRLLLRLTEPLPAKRKDRLLIRDQALQQTLGGGEVIANQPFPSRLRSPRRRKWLDAMNCSTARDSLAAALQLGPVVVEDFAALWDLSSSAMNDRVIELNAAIFEYQAVLNSLRDQWKADLLEHISAASTDATQGGLKANQFAAHIPESIKEHLLSELVAEDKLSTTAGRFDLSHRKAMLSVEEQQMLDRISPLLSGSPPASLGDIAKALSLSMSRLEAQLLPLRAKGAIIQVNSKRYVLPETLLQLSDLASEMQTFTVKQIRDRTGFGRNFIIEIFEYFDARGFTRREADHRKIIGTIQPVLPNIAPRASTS